MSSSLITVPRTGISVARTGITRRRKPRNWESTNLMIDGDFVLGTTAQWGIFSASTLSWDTTEAYFFGVGSLKVDTPGGGPFEGTQTGIMPVTPLLQYACATRVKGPSGVQHVLGLDFLLYNGAALVLQVPNAVVALNDNWVELNLSIDLAATPTVNGLRIRIFTGATPLNIDFYVDAVHLRQGTLEPIGE